MKISKLILACVLSGMVGNVFAERSNITCIINNFGGGQDEFNFFLEDNSPNKIGLFINRNTVKYFDADIGSEIIKFDFYMDAKGEINRRTGYIEIKNRWRSYPNILEVGECEKTENVVKKF